MTERVSVYRALFAIDVERSSARDNAGYARMREALFPAVVEAFEASGIDWARCETQDRGDELIVLVEPDVPKSRLVYPLLGHLAETLRHRNRTAREDDVIRVRVALHAGDLVRDAHGLTGSPKVVLARMLNAPATKLALAGTPAATVVLVVSDVFHTDVISQGHKGIHPEEFAGTTVAITDSKTVRAWLTVIGHRSQASAHDRSATLEKARQASPGDDSDKPEQVPTASVTPRRRRWLLAAGAAGVAVLMIAVIVVLVSRDELGTVPPPEKDFPTAAEECHTATGAGEILPTGSALTSHAQLGEILDFGPMNGSVWRTVKDSRTYIWGRAGSDDHDRQNGGIMTRWKIGNGPWHNCAVPLPATEPDYVYSPAVATQISGKDTTIEVCLWRDTPPAHKCSAPRTNT
ncbi:hypothetical protein EV193_102567 [Herbihabitans rhizosphaerae]|uniref:Guanylate cyclase domain-containing protein n=1 Tax=Herbihabitans rhizosphaerae TaxID=1872711 RepID=A0A4Q7L2X9_9PSEU|nr:hypothetical protein [Herbihabitans rhizosphaerae]RZS43587.1 hypothetical protein EV193_102567 [Herbihabitans rhizosphaerae]